jgi:hypothetical protein
MARGEMAVPEQPSRLRHETGLPSPPVKCPSICLMLMTPTGDESLPRLNIRSGKCGNLLYVALIRNLATNRQVLPHDGAVEMTS